MNPKLTVTFVEELEERDDILTEIVALINERIAQLAELAKQAAAQAAAEAAAATSEESAAKGMGKGKAQGGGESGKRKR